MFSSLSIFYIFYICPLIVALSQYCGDAMGIMDCKILRMYLFLPLPSVLIRLLFARSKFSLSTCRDVPVFRVYNLYTRFTSYMLYITYLVLCTPGRSCRFVFYCPFRKRCGTGEGGYLRPTVRYYQIYSQKRGFRIRIGKHRLRFSVFYTKRYIILLWRIVKNEKDYNRFRWTHILKREINYIFRSLRCTVYARVTDSICFFSFPDHRYEKRKIRPVTIVFCSTYKKKKKCIVLFLINKPSVLEHWRRGSKPIIMTLITRSFFI